ncbi:hypothetical protein D9619_012007 [Psilocybe cf. subviscida]|uniref:Uncharacterized protein n=1 Tax=Psilocybe cf. subviscida TaxID=2480587 RepID=A0A8H5B1N5_9AGAR|nr:hypothetical protein D9619_012007 [Psilocybe cf. subviscida]
MSAFTFIMQDVRVFQETRARDSRTRTPVEAYYCDGRERGDGMDADLDGADAVEDGGTTD